MMMLKIEYLTHLVMYVCMYYVCIISIPARSESPSWSNLEPPAYLSRQDRLVGWGCGTHL